MVLRLFLYFFLHFVQFGTISASIGTTRTGFRGEGQRALSGTIDVFKGWILAPFRAVLGGFRDLPETNKSDNPFRAIRQTTWQTANFSLQTLIPRMKPIPEYRPNRLFLP